MKFGTQILDKSVPAWKLNNIDYQQLKDGIKKCTTRQDKSFHPSCLDDDKELQSLEELFRGQFRMINIFISMKLKECSSRIISIERVVSELRDAEISPKKTKRIRLVNVQLDRCNTELQKLSRYLILQKIAIRKLFKKFRKHYTYSEAVSYQFIESLKTSPEMVAGHEGISLLSVDLDPYLFEISLIVEILHEMNDKDKTCTNSKNRDTPYASSVQSTRSILNHINSNLTFDHCFLSKYSHLKSFLISQENEDEIKFLLLTSGFALIEDSVMETSNKFLKQKNFLSKRKGSVRSLASLRDLHQYDTCSSPDSAANVGNLEQGEGPRGATLSSSLPSQTRLSKNDPVLENSSQSFNTILEPLSSSHTDFSTAFKSTSMNLFPNVLVSYPNSNHSVLMCNVGGLRNHISTDSIRYDRIQSVLDGGSLGSLENLRPIDRVCLEWCYTHNYRKAPFSLRTKKTRFILSSSIEEGYDAEYLISLDDNIQVNGEKLPYAILEVKMLKKSHENLPTKRHLDRTEKNPLLSQISKKFLKDNLSVYPLEQNLTLWNIASRIHSGVDPLSILSDQTFLSIEDLFRKGTFMLGKEFESEEDSDNLAKADYLSNPTELTNLSSSGNGTTHVRYWNEFDNEEEDPNQGFYIDGDNDSDSNQNNGFLRFSPFFIISMHKILQRLRSAFHSSNMNSVNPPQLKRNNHSYGSFASESTANDTSTTYANEINKLWDLGEPISESLYEIEHDEVVSFFYISMILISAVTTGITIGVMTSLLANLTDDTELENQGSIITVIIVSLSSSLISSTFSLLLLFSRYSLGPAWHYFSGVLLFVLIIITVCYSLIEILFP